MKTKIIAVFLIILLIINLILFAFKKISNFVFWLIIIICALFAYKGLPYIRKTS